MSDLLFDPVRVHWAETVSRLVWVPFGVVAVFSQNARYHAAITLTALALYVAFLTAIQLR